MSTIQVQKWIRQGEARQQRRSLDVQLGILYFVVGFAPISALALSILGLLPLYVGALLFVLPAVTLGVGLSLQYSEYGKLAGQGLLTGIVAVLLYDCTRIPFVIAGVWGDFIPHISERLLLTTEPNWVIGYMWRYLGNGGGMGLSFIVGARILYPRGNKWLFGIGYGVTIWLCLLLTLLLAPHGEGQLFELTPVTLGLSLLGHVVYGGALSLGWVFFPGPADGEEPPVGHPPA